MPLLPEKALVHFENMIYLPMLLIILERDRQFIEKGPFKFKSPYLKLIDHVAQRIRRELQVSSTYLKRHQMKIVRNRTDDLFTEYIFIHRGYEDHRKYLNIRLRNRSEELLSTYVNDSYLAKSNDSKHLL